MYIHWVAGSAAIVGLYMYVRWDVNTACMTDGEDDICLLSKSEVKWIGCIKAMTVPEPRLVPNTHHQ
jgi:hypothetical protein